jgi:hypothetical protein
MTRTVGIIGNRATVDAFMNTREGRATARDMAADVFANADALVAYELGDDLNLPAAVMTALDRLIVVRDKDELLETA